jgi:hypothetical protein
MLLSMFFLVLFVLVRCCESLAPEARVTKHVVHATSLRRSILSLAFLVAVPSVSSALDFDAFINKELSTDQVKPELTSDEALASLVNLLHHAVMLAFVRVYPQNQALKKEEEEDASMPMERLIEVTL